MADDSQDFAIGIEEEYQVVDARTRALKPVADQVLRLAQRSLSADEVQPEFHLSQIEIASPVCRTLDQVRAEVTRLRGTLIAAAARNDERLVAAGTHPFSAPERQPITPKERYTDMAADYQHLARELVIFGCHVHVSVHEPELAVQVVNRARLWLAPLLALSANSPFWCGEDTGYASFRTETWTRWPMSGPPPHFESRADYDDLVSRLVQTEVISDASKIYWDIRLAAKHPTVEFRIADVCLTVDEAVMIAGLCRALARTCAEDARQKRAYAAVRMPLLRAASWRAARYGLFGTLIDLTENRSVPAPDLIEKMLDFLRPALETDGDWEMIGALVHETLAHGNAAARQRDVRERAQSWDAVVDFLADETARGIALKQLKTVL